MTGVTPHCSRPRRENARPKGRLDDFTTAHVDTGSRVVLVTSPDAAMKAAIPSVSIGKLTTEQLDVGQLNIGPMAVGRLQLDTVHLGLSTGEAKFQNLRVSVGLAISLDWRVEVRVPPFGSWHWDGTIDMGTKTFAIGLGDVTLPGLETFSLDLGSVAVDGVQATIAPLMNIHLGSLLAEQVTITDAAAPVPDLQLLGIGLGRIVVDGLSVPGATAGSATVARVAGQAFPVGTVNINGLAIPEFSAGDIASGSIDASGTSNPFRFEADAGVLKLTLRVVPSAGTQADALTLSAVKSSGSIGSIELQDVVLPYEILNLTLGQLGIDSIDVPGIEVS